MSTTLTRNSKDLYVALVSSFPLRPIRAPAAHQQAKARLRSIAGMRGSAVRDYKAVLVSLIADYERSANLRLETKDVTPAEIILHLLAEREMSVNALAKTLNISQSSLSDMLNGRRGWSKQAIVRICSHLGLQPGLFLR